MKRFLMAAVVACALSGTTLAGDIPSVGTPKAPPQETTSPTLLGDIPSGDKADSVSDAALSAILTALGLASF